MHKGPSEADVPSSPPLHLRQGCPLSSAPHRCQPPDLRNLWRMTEVRNSFGGTYFLARQRPERIITNALRRNSKKLYNTKTPSPPSRGS